MPTLDDFNAFIALLARHDWLYDYSDDHSVWKRGCAAERELRTMALKHEIYARAFAAFKIQRLSLANMSYDELNSQIEQLHRQVAAAETV